jgi:ribonuclease Z
MRIKLLALMVLAIAAIVPAAALAQAPDSLKVTVCGSGGPLPIKDRAKACVMVQAGGNLYLVDIGPEATKNLMLWRSPLATAKVVFITHLHSDHIGGLGEFNLQSWVAGRAAPLKVIGPEGVDHLTAGMNEAYAQDHIFRNAHHEHGDIKLPIAAGLMESKVLNLPKAGADGVSAMTAYTDGALKVTAIAVAHNPVTPAFAYRFDYKGRSVVISGDTRKWPPLAQASKGADVLLHEAQNNDMTRQMAMGLKGMGMDRMSSIMGDTVTYHTTPVEAAEIAKAAGVKLLVLYHLTQAGLPFYTVAAFTKGMDAVGFANWKLATDGMTIDLPVGSDEIKLGQN